MNQSEVMTIVQRVCNTQSVGCRSLNKSADTRLLMDALSVPSTAEIWEIPLDWDGQIVVVFELPNDKNYYTLFAGIGTDGRFYFQTSIEGKIINGEYHELDDAGTIVLPVDYFVKQGASLWNLKT